MRERLPPSDSVAVNLTVAITGALSCGAAIAFIDYFWAEISLQQILAISLLCGFGVFVERQFIYK